MSETGTVDVEAAQRVAERRQVRGRHGPAVARAADEIAVVEGGRVVERGTHGELVTLGGLDARLSRTQFADVPALAA